MPADGPGVTTDEHAASPGGNTPTGDPAEAPLGSAPDGAGTGRSEPTHVGGNGGSAPPRAWADPMPVPPAPAVQSATAAAGAPAAEREQGLPSPTGAPPTDEQGLPKSVATAGAVAAPAPGREAAPPAPALQPGAAPIPAPAVGVPGGAEPPPAPVLVPEAEPRGLRRGRHAKPRRTRASKRGLRVTQRLWSISPWSVFKVSALFYLCMALIILVAGTLLYNAGRSVGTIDQFESFVTRMGAYGRCVPTEEVPEGAVFEEDLDKCDEGEVLIGGFALDDGTLFRAAAIGGGILVAAGSIGNVLLTVLLNLLNELTGGLRHTVIREPVQRPPEAAPVRRGGRGRLPGGPESPGGPGGPGGPPGQPRPPGPGGSPRGAGARGPAPARRAAVPGPAGMRPTSGSQRPGPQR
jgi:hypothetical protein